MKARTLSALFASIVLITGCSSGHAKFVYTVGPATSSVFGFRENGDGTLTPLNLTASTGSTPVSVVMHPSGNFIYIANFNGGSVVLFDANRSSGALSIPTSTSVIPPVPPANFFNVGTNPVAMAISSDGSFIYVLNQGSSNISAFRIDGITGKLAPVNNQGSTFPTQSAPSSLALSPKGNLLYVANPTLGTVTSFTVGADGSLAPTATTLAASSVTVGTAPSWVTIDPTGRFLFVTDPPGNQIFGFAIQANGALSALNGSPYAVGTQPAAIATDPAGSFLYVANQGSNNVSGFIIDSQSGALSPITGSPFPTGGRTPLHLSVDSTTSVVYVADSATNDIAAFAIQKDGSLVPVANSPFGVATGPSWVITVQD